ncbi:MAG TPA: hypothetical protein VHE59_08285 [Mucilaginibacter sp.]|nr:hypothetical protein [Mucilaginibacter sp.]
MKEIKPIITKLLIFFAVMAFLDYVFGTALKKCYFLQKKGYDYLATYALDSAKSDMLIVGSSRAAHHYNPAIIQDSLHATVFNAGADGTFMFYYDAILRSALKRYHPKVVIMDLLPDEFEKGQEAYDHLSLLLPYYSYHPEIRPIIQLRGPYEKYKLLSKTYPYNSKLLSAITTLLHAKQGVKSYDGYIPLNNKMVVAEPVMTFKNDIDTLKLAYFKNFINECTANGIKLIVSVSPIYIKYNPSKSIELGKEICAAHHIPFFNYLHDPDFGKPMFSDPHHLNSQGADLFTKKFIADIRPVLK